jgi:hypothetical protein
MGSFIPDGASVLPPVKQDSRPPSGANTEWAAGDANKTREALLDLRTSEIANAQVIAAETAARIAADAALVAAGVPIATSGSSFVTATGSSVPHTLADRANDVMHAEDYGSPTTDIGAAINAAQLVMPPGSDTTKGGRVVVVPDGANLLVTPVEAMAGGPGKWTGWYSVRGASRHGSLITQVNPGVMFDFDSDLSAAPGPYPGYFSMRDLTLKTANASGVGAINIWNGLRYWFNDLTILSRSLSADDAAITIAGGGAGGGGGNSFGHRFTNIFIGGDGESHGFRFSGDKTGGTTDSLIIGCEVAGAAGHAIWIDGRFMGNSGDFKNNIINRQNSIGNLTIIGSDLQGHVAEPFYGDPARGIFMAGTYFEQPAQWLQPGAAAYSAGTTYRRRAFVTYGGKVYISIRDGNLNKQPDTHPTYWAGGTYSAAGYYGHGAGYYYAATPILFTSQGSNAGAHHLTTNMVGGRALDYGIDFRPGEADENGVTAWLGQSNQGVVSHSNSMGGANKGYYRLGGLRGAKIGPDMLNGGQENNAVLTPYVDWPNSDVLRMVEVFDHQYGNGGAKILVSKPYGVQGGLPVQYTSFQPMFGIGVDTEVGGEHEIKAHLHIDARGPNYLQFDGPGVDAPAAFIFRGQNANTIFTGTTGDAGAGADGIIVLGNGGQSASGTAAGRGGDFSVTAGDGKNGATPARGGNINLAAGNGPGGVGSVNVGIAGNKLGFIGATAILRPTVTGLVNSAATVADLKASVKNLLTALANLGLITDGTT